LKFKPTQANRQTLSGIRIFQDLTGEECDAVARFCTAGLYARNTTVVSDKDNTHDVFFIASGLVRVTTLSVSGKEVMFRDMGPGSVFGDLSAIDGQTRSASVITLDNSLIVWMTADAFWKALENYPSVNRAVLKGLVYLVRRLSERVKEFSTLGVKQRLHVELLRLARTSMTGENSASISPPPTHAVLASRISTHREGVTRELHKLTEQGLLAKQKGALLVPDVAQLASLVNFVENE